jgi:hypothetical protein
MAASKRSPELEALIAKLEEHRDFAKKVVDKEKSGGGDKGAPITCEVALSVAGILATAAGAILETGGTDRDSLIAASYLTGVADGLTKGACGRY